MIVLTKLIFYFLLLFIILLFFLILYKKASNNLEKFLFILLIFVFFIPLGIYYLDLYDLPTKFRLIKNVDIDRWFEFIISYVSTIIGTLVSSFIVIILTLKQINIQRDSEKEEKRLENKPIMDYEFTNNLNAISKYYHTFDIDNDGELYNSFFKINNIGMNHARNVFFKIAIDGTEYEMFSFGGHQFFIKKEEFVWINFQFCIKSINENDIKDICIKVLYDDLLSNSYEQCITAKLEFKYEKNHKIKMFINELNVENEKVI